MIGGIQSGFRASEKTEGFLLEGFPSCADIIDGFSVLTGSLDVCALRCFSLALPYDSRSVSSLEEKCRDLFNGATLSVECVY